MPLRTPPQIRRAYRNLVTKVHPDKGGDPEKFAMISRAYDILSNSERREQYDTTGETEKTVEEDFMDSFGGGSFRDKARVSEARDGAMMDQIVELNDPQKQSHSAGFEAWMRARGDAANMVFTAETAAEQFGVVKSSYEAVPLPPVRAYDVKCKKLGQPRDVLERDSEAIPAELEWGEVLVNIRAAPINAADLYAAQMGQSVVSDGSRLSPPFTAGNDGLGVVVKVGPGCKVLQEGDWVLPYATGMGTWRSLTVWKEKAVLKVPTDLMPVEYAAMLRELCVAYRLLEDYGTLKPGDSVIINAGTSTVGQCVIQLASMLKLRPIAVVRESDSSAFEKTGVWLKSLGASEVLVDGGSLKLELDKKKYYAKPRLALDAVGGSSAVRLADCLQDGCPLVVYGCMSGKPPQFPWQYWVGNGLKVEGFNLRRWMKEKKRRVPAMMESLAKLVNSDKLRINYTEYELSKEFDEALDHALEAGRNTKILLRMSDIGVTVCCAAGPPTPRAPPDFGLSLTPPPRALCPIRSTERLDRATTQRPPTLCTETSGCAPRAPRVPPSPSDRSPPPRHPRRQRSSRQLELGAEMPLPRTNARMNRGNRTQTHRVYPRRPVVLCLQLATGLDRATHARSRARPELQPEPPARQCTMLDCQ